MADWNLPVTKTMVNCTISETFVGEYILGEPTLTFEININSQYVDNRKNDQK